MTAQIVVSHRFLHPGCLPRSDLARTLVVVIGCLLQSSVLYWTALKTSQYFQRYRRLEPQAVDLMGTEYFENSSLLGWEDFHYAMRSCYQLLRLRVEARASHPMMQHYHQLCRDLVEAQASHHPKMSCCRRWNEIDPDLVRDYRHHVRLDLHHDHYRGLSCYELARFLDLPSPTLTLPVTDPSRL